MALIRLLQRKPNGEIGVCEPASYNAPAYGILSHTWGTEEILFRDLKPGADMSRTMSKAGWRKIEFCAQQAAADGLQYFWIDTCCIDKKNAVELSAAINSMFRWYQSAACCYVYLSDVSINEGGWQEQFRRSRWFSRGWTLQELLAPRTVKFFSREGQLLGDKWSLEREIHETTQIPVQALRGSRLAEFGVSERMAWATGRQTTIEEDQVYCLLGIFEVFMPPIYGEGDAHAFSRLREEIEKRLQRHAVESLRGLPGSFSFRGLSLPECMY
ncbi:hypothetical protein BDY17DRAFT_289208 [Neohortaea acidophila]|uniref:Heterokaryon incompatibility domain-containing protein n=1 Tax=Neohortaea acidophila TaxID=245834 RepID=A0A6A6Q553_9PEZI|nr:uncharacterized protein BDY17DRAFT_289208 [Neohortaea acidophila]KAF2487568.1 hypothetical protein BDY17DRAFT_289208 [Neohortaea acidophila]